MALSTEELLELELDSAWEAFCDSDQLNHARVLSIVDPKFYELMKLAYKHGYTDGARSIIRSQQE